MLKRKGFSTLSVYGKHSARVQCDSDDDKGFIKKKMHYYCFQLCFSSSNRTSKGLQPYEPTIPPLVEYPCEIKTYVHIKAHERMFIKA